jgi:hypothetical protein
MICIIGEVFIRNKLLLTKLNKKGRGGGKIKNDKKSAKQGSLILS